MRPHPLVGLLLLVSGISCGRVGYHTHVGADAGAPDDAVAVDAVARDARAEVSPPDVSRDGPVDLISADGVGATDVLGADAVGAGVDAPSDSGSSSPEVADALVDVGTDTMPPTPTSCLEARKAGARADGLYQIDVDGPTGPLAGFEVYCDMTFDGGGWTLIQSYDGKKVPQNFAADDGSTPILDAVPRPGVFGSLGSRSLDPLVANVSQIHVRKSFVVDRQNADATLGWWATSVLPSNGNATLPVANLRAHRLLNDGTNGDAADWAGPRVANLRWSPTAACTLSARGFPSIYWACNNGTGLHLVTDAAKWDYSAKVQDPLEVYVR